MMPRTVQPRGVPAGRVRFAEGERLDAEDVMADAAAEARLRQLHTRAVHGTWGIALGFYAASSDDGSALLVGPGFAYDATQREIVLDHPLIFDAPPLPPAAAGAAAWFDLVMRCDEPPERAQCDERSTIARVGAGAPVWRWSFAGKAITTLPDERPLAADVRLGIEQPVARVLVSAAGTMGSVDASLRRGARSFSARMASGAIDKGTPLTAVAMTEEEWVHTIDLSAAHFTAPPQVFVSMVGHPIAGINPYSGWLPKILGPFISVTGVTASSCQVRVTFARTSAAAFTWPVVYVRYLPAALVWTAVEPSARTEPAIVLRETRDTAGRPVANIAARFARLQQFPPPGGVDPS